MNNAEKFAEVFGYDLPIRVNCSEHYDIENCKHCLDKIECSRWALSEWKVKECEAEDCISRDYTARYVEEFANNEYVSEHEAETIYYIAEGVRHIPTVYPKSAELNESEADDCISRASIKKHIEDGLNSGKYGHDAVEILTEIQYMASVYPKSDKPSAHWIERFNEDNKWLECDNCHEDSNGAYNYCPNCGSPMI